MARSTNASAFDELLEKFADEDKTVFNELAEKYPDMKGYGLRQSDYNRKMNEFQAEIAYANGWKEWELNNWDDEAKSTKQERILKDQLEAAKREKEALEQQVAFGGLGDEMTFEQLEQSMGKFVKDKGILTANDLTAKEKEFRAYVDKGISPVILTAQEVALRHFKEFNEVLPGTEIIDKAFEAGAGNIKDYWESQIAQPRRIAAEKEKYETELKSQRENYEARLEKQKLEADAERQRLIGMNASSSPTDAGEANLFRDQMLGIAPKDDQSKIPNTPVGEGGIAAAAAAIYKQNGGHF
jgi:hypothetical protein